MNQHEQQLRQQLFKVRAAIATLTSAIDEANAVLKVFFNTLPEDGVEPKTQIENPTPNHTVGIYTP